MHAWSQLTSLSLSLVSFTLALIPRTYSGDYLPALPPQAFSPAAQRPDESRRSFSVGGQPSAFRLYPFARLIRFPIFWLGAALLAYIALQASNPSWVWERNETTWWLRRVNDIEWLPTSIDTPWERFNIWRQFIIYASAWLTTCTVWIGFARRRSLEIVLNILVINGVLLGLGGLYLRATAAIDTVFWLWERVPFASAFASFYYRNHAGAYLGLLAIICAALAYWHYESGRRHMRKSTPAGLYVIGLGFFCICVLFTYARGSTLALLLALIIISCYLTWCFSKSRGWLSLTAGTTLAMAILFTGAIALTAWQIDLSKMTTRIESLISLKGQEISVHHRLLTYDAAYAMLEERGMRGVGSGGFRFLFPEYIKRHPEIYRDGRFFWEHAHNDWLQIPIELGLAGSILILLGVYYLARGLIRQGIHSHALPAIVVLGCLQTLFHAWIDFPLQNPAVLLTLGSLLILVWRWSELESAE